MGLFSSNIVWQWCRYDFFFMNALNVDAIENIELCDVLIFFCIIHSQTPIPFFLVFTSHLSQS